MRSIIVFIIVVVSGSIAQAAILAGPVINPTNGHSYYLLEQDTWTNSEAEAVTLGGHLATINDATENQWVFDTFAGFGSIDRNLWIGLTDASKEGAFTWISGEPVDYLNWAPAQPNEFVSGQDYVHMFKPNTSGANSVSGAWNDEVNIGGAGTGDSTIPYGVVEVVPEPSTALLALTGLTLLSHRKRYR